MSKKWRRSLAVLIIAATAGAAAAPPGAFADATISDGGSYASIPISSRTAEGIFSTINSIPGYISLHAGDCDLSWQSYIKITRPDDPQYPVAGPGKNAWVQWHGVALTHASPVDVWQGYFRFLDANNNYIGSSPALHGASMGWINYPYYWDDYSPIWINPAYYDSIAKVEWYGSC